jgi:hypothetical protein
MDYYTGLEEEDRALDERVALLSPTMRRLLAGDAIPTLAQQCAEKHGLSEMMRRGIEIEAALILMHLEPVDQYGANLVSEHLIPVEAALDIEHTLREHIFTPLMSELGTSDEIADGDDAGSSPVVSEATRDTRTPAITTAPHVPVARVMPQTPAAVPHNPKASTELPNALLQNLKASLMHGGPEEPLEGTNPAPSYNAILNTKPPAPPTT